MITDSKSNPFLRRLRSFQMFDATGLSNDLRRSLNFVIYAVMANMFSAVVTGGAAWTGFQRDIIRASDFQIGIIAAIPVAASTIQLFISYIVEKRRNRRFLFFFFGLAGRFLWIPIGLVPFIIPQAFSDLRVWLVVVLVAFVSFGNSFSNICFQSLLSDLVPMRIRGRYFSARQRMFLIVGVFAGLIVSWIVDASGPVGYTIVLVIAGISGMTDIACFFFVKWPPMQVPPENQKSTGFLTMLREVAKNKSFMKVTLFFTIWHFSLNVSGPFFNVYMLNNLRMSYTQITMFNQITSNIITIFFVSKWGNLIDTHGHKPLMQIVCVFIIMVPVLWIFINPGNTWLIIISNITSGLFYPVIDLSQQNLCLNQSGEKNRSMYLAVFFATVNLLGVSLGNAVGGYLVQVPYAALAQQHISLFGVALNQYHYIFLTSSLLRVFTVLVFLRMIQEEGVRPAAHVARHLYQSAKSSFRRKRDYARTMRIRRKVRKEERANESSKTAQ